MKRWKILHELDKESSKSSSRYSKSRVQMRQNGQTKINLKVYTPLRRSKIERSGLNNHSKNLSATQLFSPSHPQKYIRCVQTASIGSAKKIRTQYTDQMFGLGLESLQDIQQNFSSSLGLQRQTQRKGYNKSHQKIEKPIIPPLQTDRIFSRDILSKNEKSNQKPNFFRNKAIASNYKVQYLMKKIDLMKKDQISFRQEVRQRFKKFKMEIQQERDKWRQLLARISQKQNKNPKNQAINKILEDYNEYKLRVENLEEQKQVFLQSLIKMAPI